MNKNVISNIIFGLAVLNLILAGVQISNNNIQQVGVNFNFAAVYFAIGILFRNKQDIMDK